MNTPGFAAEASLHGMTKTYQAEGLSQLSKGIYPAQWEPGYISQLPTTSPRTYGVVHPGEVDSFVRCVRQCQAAGAPYSDCQRSCCKQFTKYYSCVIP